MNATPLILDPQSSTCGAPVPVALAVKPNAAKPNAAPRRTRGFWDYVLSGVVILAGIFVGFVVASILGVVFFGIGIC